MRKLILFLVVSLASPLAQGNAPANETRETLRAEVLKLINRDRAAHGLHAVKLDPAASALADVGSPGTELEFAL